MNTDFLIREEIDMQSSKTTHDESDFIELARIAEMGLVEEQPNPANVSASEVGISQDVNVESSIEKKQDGSEGMGSDEVVVMQTAEEVMETAETAVLDGGMLHTVSESEAGKVQPIDTLDSNDFIVKSDLAAIPDTVLMDAVEEITHSTVEETPDESLSADTIAKNDAVDKKIIDQVGHLTRNLHNSLRELGYDKRLQLLASEVPEAQDKLSYVASKTEQAADRTLNATEIAMPIQEKLSLEATQLSEKWKQAFEEHREQPDTEKFKLLLIETLSYIDKVPEQADATNAQLMEIMMAQDFQDLTGQVIKKVTHMVQRLEHDLVQLLLANVPPANKQVSSEEGLMNGPVVNPEKSPDTLNSQDQVDDLLASLGF